MPRAALQRVAGNACFALAVLCAAVSIASGVLAQPSARPTSSPALDTRLDEHERRLDVQDKMFQQIAETAGVNMGAVGALVSGFGVLISTVVLFFAIRSQDAAVNAAVNASRTATNGLLESFQGQMNAVLSDSQRKSGAIGTTLGEVQSELARVREAWGDLEKRQERQFAEGGEQATLAEALSSVADRGGVEGFYSSYAQGMAAQGEGRLDEAIEAYARAETQTPDLVSQAQVRNSIALAHWNNGDRAGAQRLWARLLEDFEPRLFEAPALADEIARALVNIGFALANDQRSGEAIEKYEEVVRRFGTSSKVALCEQVARALIHGGLAQANAGKAKDALIAFEQVVSRYETSTEPTLREEVARALFNKAYMLAEEDDREAAIATYGRLIESFGKDHEHRRQVARALINKGDELASLRRYGEAAEAYTEVVARLTGETDRDLSELADQARRARDELPNRTRG